MGDLMALVCLLFAESKHADIVMQFAWRYKRYDIVCNWSFGSIGSSGLRTGILCYLSLNIYRS